MEHSTCTINTKFLLAASFCLGRTGNIFSVIGEILQKLANPPQLIHNSRCICSCREFASYCRELASFDKKVSPDNHCKSRRFLGIRVVSAMGGFGLGGFGLGIYGLYMLKIKNVE